jgi:hypothetical protein
LLAQVELVDKAALILNFGPVPAQLLATRPEDKTVATGALKSNGRKSLESCHQAHGTKCHA